MSDLEGLLKSRMRMDEGGWPLARRLRTMSPPTRPDPPHTTYRLSSLGGRSFAKSIGRVLSLSYVSWISLSVHGAPFHAHASSGTSSITWFILYR